MQFLLQKNAYQRKNDEFWNVKAFVRNVWYTILPFLRLLALSQSRVSNGPLLQCLTFVSVVENQTIAALFHVFFRLSSISWIESLTLRQSDVLLLPISPLPCEFLRLDLMIPPLLLYPTFERIFGKEIKYVSRNRF